VAHDPRIAWPIGLNGLFKAVVKLAFWAMASDAKDVSGILVEGIAWAPPDFVDGALNRMESMRSGLFWEVNERVIAFDWVEEPLRAQIPRLRAALKRAHAGGGTEEPVAEPASSMVMTDLVAPTLPSLPVIPANGKPAVASEKQGVTSTTQ